jgi:ABC-2 type transport system permease protein
MNRRTAPALMNVWGGIWLLAWRRHFTRQHLLALAGMLAALAVTLVSFFHAGNGREQYLAFVSAFYLTFLVPLIAFIAGGGAWRDDLKSEASDYFFLRPIPKALYLVLRYGAQVMCSQIDFAVALAVVAAVGLARGVPGAAAALPAMCAAEFMTVAAFVGFGFFCAVVTSRWVVVGLIYGAVIEGGLGNAPLAINRFAMTHQVRMILHSIVNRAWAGADLGPVVGGAARPWVAVGILAGFSLVWVGMAAALFSRRELLGEATGD